MDLKNKVVIITGASGRIGKAMAMKFAGARASVVLCDRSEDKLKKLKDRIESDGGKAMVVKTDVTRLADFEKVISKTLTEYGSIDVLINNAGLMPPSLVEKIKIDKWEKMLEVNIKGVLNGAAAVMPTMCKNNSGHIINVSSSASQNYFPGRSVHCATKASVKMFSEGLRKKVASEYGINVTCIEPGTLDKGLFDSIADDDIPSKQKQMKELTKLEAEDISNSILYALNQPDRVNIKEVYSMQAKQG